MSLNFKNINEWIVPNKKFGLSFYKTHLHTLLFYINKEYEIILAPIIPKLFCKINDCHNNVFNYVNTYNGEQILGYYIAIDKENYKNAIAILHSVVKKRDGTFIDITPTNHNLQYMIFVPLKDTNILNYPKTIEFFEGKLYCF